MASKGKLKLLQVLPKQMKRPADQPEVLMKKNLFASLFILIGVCVGIVGFLLYNGLIWFNNPSVRVYPVRGVDISSYQGNIDWPVLSKQGVDFAFIKATEGSSSQDKQFQYNWVNANQAKLKVGAYHFFSFDSSGTTQADNFIHIVPKQAKSLPPVVDIELYGEKGKKPPDKAKTNEALDELLDKLETYYGKKPIIYATEKSYDLYIKGGYADYPIWIRDVFRSPLLLDQREWTFWQYSDHQVLKGYKGKEKYIDMNVYRGTKAEFEAFIQ
jgi:Lyzozyme M1 (1,4-beta-N-acetylmuramidase)